MDDELCRRTWMCSIEVARDKATYNCLCEKTGLRRSRPMCFTIWPWALLIVMANASCMGNCRLVNLMAKLSPVREGVNDIRGMRAVSPAWSPLIRRISNSRFDIWMTVPHVPLQRPLFLSMLRSKITGQPILRERRARGKPVGLSPWRNSKGMLLFPLSEEPSKEYESALQNVVLWPGNCERMSVFSFQMLSFVGAKMAQCWKNLGEGIVVYCSIEPYTAFIRSFSEERIMCEGIETVGDPWEPSDERPWPILSSQFENAWESALSYMRMLVHKWRT